MFAKLKSFDYSRLKKFIKPFLIIFGIYVFSILGILRFGISYVDDRNREVYGYGWMSDFGRITSSVFSFVFLQVSSQLADISPFSQILAMAFLSISSLLLVYYFGNYKKLSHLILSCFLGINPFTVSCWLYKFDSPCMALGLLSSILPFLFLYFDKKSIWHYERFWLASYVGILITLSTYQTFLAIYPLIVLGFLFKDFLDNKSLKKQLKLIFFSVSAFLVCTLFRTTIFTISKGYVNTSPLSANDFLPGILSNLSIISNYIISNLSANWRIFLCLSIANISLLCFKNSNKQKSKRVLDSLACLLFLICGYIISIGTLVFLSSTNYDMLRLRYFACVSSVLAIAFIIVFNMKQKKISRLSKVFYALPIFCLLYLFTIYNFILANALKSQDTLNYYRSSELIKTLTELYTEEDLKTKNLCFIGNITDSAEVMSLSRYYPITSEHIFDFKSPAKIWLSATYIVEISGTEIDPVQDIAGAEPLSKPDDAVLVFSNRYEDIYEHTDDYGADVIYVMIK